MGQTLPSAAHVCQTFFGFFYVGASDTTEDSASPSMLMNAAFDIVNGMKDARLESEFLGFNSSLTECASPMAVPSIFNVIDTDKDPWVSIASLNLDPVVVDETGGYRNFNRIMGRLGIDVQNDRLMVSVGFHPDLAGDVYVKLGENLEQAILTTVRLVANRVSRRKDVRMYRYISSVGSARFIYRDVRTNTSALSLIHKENP